MGEKVTILGAQSYNYINGGKYDEYTYTMKEAFDGSKQDGSGYESTYSLAKGDAQAPFDCKMFLYLNEDGTARLTVSAEGPIAATDLSGTWTSENGQITVTIAK